MKRHTTILAAALLVSGLVLPSTASAQLSARERDRAREIARIQAKADAEERARVRRTRLDMAQANCRSSNRVWDYANETCKPREIVR